MDFVILDLEFNGAYSHKKHKFLNEIIEIGAVKCDSQFNIIDKFSMLVTPQVGKKLNPYVKKLTHINMEELQSVNQTFTHVLSKLKKFLGDAVLLTWGQSDVLVMMDNFEYYLGERRIDFVKYYCNVQEYCEDELGLNDKAHQLGLSNCMQMLDVNYDETKLHRAYDDAYLTMLCFKKLCNYTTLPKYIEEVNDDFYKKVTFKNTFIYDIRSPLIDKREMYFLCDVCGHKTRRKTKWRVKNKSFRAEFRCTRCKKDFEGRISFKKTYDGVRVERKTYDIVSNDEKSGSACETHDDSTE